MEQRPESSEYVTPSSFDITVMKHSWVVLWSGASFLVFVVEQIFLNDFFKWPFVVSG